LRRSFLVARFKAFLGGRRALAHLLAPLLLALLLVLPLEKAAEQTGALLDLQIAQPDADGEHGHVRHANLPDPERRADVRAVESRAEGHTLVAVDVHAELLVADRGAERLLHSGDPHAAADELDGRDVRDADASDVEGPRHGHTRTREQVAAHPLELVPAEAALEVEVGVKPLDVNGDVQVG